MQPGQLAFTKNLPEQDGPKPEKSKCRQEHHGSAIPHVWNMPDSSVKELNDEVHACYQFEKPQADVEPLTDMVAKALLFLEKCQWHEADDERPDRA